MKPAQILNQNDARRLILDQNWNQNINLGPKKMPENKQWSQNTKFELNMMPEHKFWIKNEAVTPIMNHNWSQHKFWTKMMPED